MANDKIPRIGETVKVNFNGAGWYTDYLCQKRLTVRCKDPTKHKGIYGCCDEVGVLWWGIKGIRWEAGQHPWVHVDFHTALEYCGIAMKILLHYDIKLALEMWIQHYAP